MPVESYRLSLGTSPQKVVTSGRQAGQTVPQFRVKLPGWDDVIKLTPTSALDPAVAAAKRRERQELMASSPVPDIVTQLADLATQLDNIQDALVALSVAGRVATSLAGRAIPGLGWVATAADVLNMANVFYPKTLAATAAAGAARGARAVEGRVRGTLSKEAKRSFNLVGSLQGGTYAQRLAATERTGKIGFGWGEALQLAQVSDQFFGVGLSLGPLFAVAGDVGFGLLRGAEFDLSNWFGNKLDITDPAVAPLMGAQLDPLVSSGGIAGANARLLAQLQGAGYTDREVAEAAAKQVKITVDWAGVLPLTDRALGKPPGWADRQYAEFYGPAVAPVAGALRAVNGALKAGEAAAIGAGASAGKALLWLSGVRGALSFEDHLEVAVTALLAVTRLKPYLQAVNPGLLMGARARELFGRARVPFAGDTSRATVGEVTARLRDGAARARLDWLDEAPDPVLGAFARSVVSEFQRELNGGLAGPDGRVLEDSGPLWRGAEAMHALDLLPPAERSDAEMVRYIEGMSELVRPVGEGLVPRQAAVELYRACFPGVADVGG